MLAKKIFYNFYQNLNKKALTIKMKYFIPKIIFIINTINYTINLFKIVSKKLLNL